MLQEILATDVYRFFVVFARVSLIFQFFPGISAPYVSTRVRLGLAVMLTMLVTPLVAGTIPPRPETVVGLTLLIAAEATIGAFFGFILQAIMATLHTAGTVMGFTSGMANAMVFDPISQQQSSMITGLLGIVAVVLIFVTGTHLLIIEAMVDSYSLLPPGEGMMWDDMSTAMVTFVNRSFGLGIQLASPFIVFAIVFQTGLGLMSRLMPQLNVFFVGLPIQLLLGMSLLMVVVPGLMLAFFTLFRDMLGTFLAGG